MRSMHALTGKTGVLLTVVGTVAVALLVVALLFGGGFFLVLVLIPIACGIGIVRNARNPNRPHNDGGNAVSTGPLG